MEGGQEEELLLPRQREDMDVVRVNGGSWTELTTM